ncbi:hypothetical protein BsWGS_21202 [Bradybaena similaris]
MAMRTILGAGYSSSAAMEVALEIPPLSLRRKQLKYNYWLQASQDGTHPAYPAFEDTNSKFGGIPIGKWQRPAGWDAAEDMEQSADLARTRRETNIYKPRAPYWEYKHSLTPA